MSQAYVTLQLGFEVPLCEWSKPLSKSARLARCNSEHYRPGRSHGEPWSLASFPESNLFGRILAQHLMPEILLFTGKDQFVRVHEEDPGPPGTPLNKLECRNGTVHMVVPVAGIIRTLRKPVSPPGHRRVYLSPSCREQTGDTGQ